MPFGVATDAANNVYVADTANQTVRRISPAGEVTTLAGAVGLPGSADGPCLSARFYTPVAIAVTAAGDLYIADLNNHCIRKISQGMVTTARVSRTT